MFNNFYLSDSRLAEKFMADHELALDELEAIVGRFKVDHWRFAGKLRGEVCFGKDGKARIRHHFNKKLLWKES